MHALGFCWTILYKVNVIQTSRQAQQVIASMWLEENTRHASNRSFHFRSGGVTHDNSSCEMKAALKNFAVTYCGNGFSGHLTFCLNEIPAIRGYVKIVVTPRVGREFILNMDTVSPYEVYDRNGEEANTKEDLKAT